MKPTSSVVVSVLAAGLVGALFALAYAGALNVGADESHWSATTRALSWARDRSIAVRAAGIAVPDLADPELIALGAEHYGAMCVGCHLAPGVGDNELRQGLNPKPPNLTERRDRSPAESFWIIKHGVKMTGMPAWGVTHDDDSIWGLVAFLQQMPSMDVASYQSLTNPEMGNDTVPDAHGHGHDHGDDGHPHGATEAAPELPREHVHDNGAEREH